MNRRRAFLRSALIVAAAAAIGTVPASARHDDRAWQGDVARLARQLDDAAARVTRVARAEDRRWDDRGRRDGRLERVVRDFAYRASRFEDLVHRRGFDRDRTRPEVEALLASFYAADREIRRADVDWRVRDDFERARWAMDALVDRYGGYRTFRHVRPGRVEQGHPGRGRGHEKARGRGHRDRGHGAWDDDHGRRDRDDWRRDRRDRRDVVPH